MTAGSRVLRALSRSCAARDEAHRLAWHALAARIANRIASTQLSLGRGFSR